MKMIKRIAAGLLLGITAGCLVNMHPAQAGLLGDVDLDGQISLMDAQTVLRGALRIQNLSEQESQYADVNRDGSVTLEDAQKLLRAALKIEPIEEVWITELPVTTGEPSDGETNPPTIRPTGYVTAEPSDGETNPPTPRPTGNVTASPAVRETNQPTVRPSEKASSEPEASSPVAASEQPTYPVQSPDTHVHSFTTTTIEGNCQTKGKNIYTCIECGYQWEEESTYGAHQYEDVEEAPTCEWYGRIMSTCKICGDQYWTWQNDKLPLGHTFDENQYTISESIRTAIYSYPCTRCGNSDVKLYFSCGTISSANASNTAAPVSYENFNRAYIVNRDIYLLPGEKFGVEGRARNDDNIVFSIENAQPVSGQNASSDGVTAIYEWSDEYDTYHYIIGEKYGTSVLVAKNEKTGEIIGRFTVHVNHTFVEAGKEFMQLLNGNAEPENDTQLYTKVQALLTELGRNYTEMDAQIPYLAAKELTGMQFNSATTDYEKVQTFAKWMRENVTYGTMAGEDGQHVMEVLEYGKAVCAGYAKTWQYFCELEDIPVWYMSGQLQNIGSHAWNMVYVDTGNGLGKQWYYVDPTNDVYDFNKTAATWIEEGKASAAESGKAEDIYSWRPQLTWYFDNAWLRAANSLYGSWSVNSRLDGSDYIHPITGEDCEIKESE